MFFILSKILVYLIMPIVIVFVLLILSRVTKRKSTQRRFFYSGLFLFFICSNGFIVNEMALLWEVPITPFAAMNKNYTWGILLTGVTKYDVMLNDRVYFTRGADRVTHTLQLYRLGKIKKILVSGGNGRINPDERKEADDIAKVLIMMGVAPEDIVKETLSRNTHESAVEVKKILEGKFKPSDCLLITSAFHMRRSVGCYAKVGWSMDGFSVDFISTPRSFSIFEILIPNSYILEASHVLVREWVGFIVYKLVGYV